MAEASFQERLNEVQATISFLQLEKTRLDKEKALIQAELDTLGIKNVDELKTAIDAKKTELEQTKIKFDLALKRLEEKTSALDKKVRGN